MARGARIIRRGTRRMTSWLSVPFTSAVMTATGGTLMVALTGLEKAKRPFTIVRTRMLISIISDQTAASESQFGAFGMVVTTDQAVASGVGAVPTPVTDAGSDAWFVHQFFHGQFTFATASGFAEGGHSEYQIDSKAMRKVSEDDDVIGVGEFASGSEGLILTISGRLLIKEH